VRLLADARRRDRERGRAADIVIETRESGKLAATTDVLEGKA
jgi:hypothetical protein